MTDAVSTPPQGATTLRRRSLRGEPTSTLTPSTGAALAALVGRGQGIPEIATALALTEDAVRVKLKEAGLLELVEAPPEGEPAGLPVAADIDAGGLVGGLIATTPAGPVIDQGPKRRGRGPNKPKPEAVGGAVPSTTYKPLPEPTLEDYTALGKLVAKARAENQSIEDMIIDARRLLKLAELFGY